MPEELPGMFYASSIWNVRTGQNNLCGPRTTFCPKKLFAKIARKQL